jgi:hypothetical protein
LLPRFFYTQAWNLKELNTALGSWTEFRHDIVLYAKQSYTAVGSALPGSLREGYVEPYPEFYRQIQQMVSNLYIKTATYFSEMENLKRNFQEFDEVMAKLIEISEKEIKGQELSEENYRDISEVALRLKSASRFPRGILGEFELNTETKMAIVTDVHTDNNSRMVLEEGIGTPFLIQIEIRKGDKMVSLLGGVFSYFEFKQPMDDRLTDEKWQTKVLKEKGRHFLPEWYSNIIR